MPRILKWGESEWTKECKEKIGRMYNQDLNQDLLQCLKNYFILINVVEDLKWGVFGMEDLGN